MGRGDRVVWSIVIPAYDEALRLPAYLQRVVAYFEERGEPYEVLVVDDGSRDGTAHRVREFQRTWEPLKLIVLPSNRGKGYAVRVGMVNATGDLRLFADADGATPIEEVDRLEPALRAGADVVIGSRVLRAPEVSVRALRHRKMVGWVFNRIVARIGLHGIADSQCGFKLFRAPVVEELFRSLRTDGFGFDVELLLLAQRRGYRVSEVPINWADQPGSKLSVITEGPRMLRQILSARANLALGRYDR
jgi:dolichyl-phosphate beta-glucosyltransferase